MKNLARPPPSPLHSPPPKVFFLTFGGLGRRLAWVAAPPLPLTPFLPTPLRHADVAAAPGRKLHVSRLLPSLFLLWSSGGGGGVCSPSPAAAALSLPFPFPPSFCSFFSLFYTSGALWMDSCPLILSRLF